jgi:predicted enzyme related to lactoylglutathione lyase
VANPVNWFHITSPNTAALEKFYKKVFGWKTSTGPDGATLMISPEAGGIPGGLGPSPDGKPSISIYVGVPDVAAHLKKIQDVGGQVAMPPMELGGGMGWIAGFFDPDGNWVGLWQAGKAAAAPKPAKEKAAKKAAAKKAAAPTKKTAAKAASPAKKVAAKAASGKAASAKKAKPSRSEVAGGGRGNGRASAPRGTKAPQKKA